eukprot:1160884-Pelagomonas_calceolata.AAC.20
MVTWAQYHLFTKDSEFWSTRWQLNDTNDAVQLHEAVVYAALAAKDASTAVLTLRWSAIAVLFCYVSGALLLRDEIQRDENHRVRCAG